MSEADPITYRVTGPVTFDNLVRIREEGETAMANAGDRAVVDLSGLENGNSVAVALLMAWFRTANAQDRAVEFIAPPAELENIVELSGLTDVLPLRHRAADAAPSVSDNQASA